MQPKEEKFTYKSVPKLGCLTTKIRLCMTKLLKSLTYSMTHLIIMLKVHLATTYSFHIFKVLSSNTTLV